MTTDITELAQSLKAAAEKATQGRWEYYPGNTSIEYNVDSMDEDQGSIVYVDSGDFTQAQTDRNGEFIALANPANILALVEALETEKRICATWRKTAESTSEKLEKAQAAERRWHRVASRVHEQACESDVKIDELEAIRAAAEKLVRCKGRYHSEQNYRALAALFGVTTPDLPPLDSESSAVTVKLTDINEFLAEVHDKTLNRAFRLLAEGVRSGDVAAMRAAGIKVEAE
ncbi:TPA: ead/Ea22-like family protein [Klebsiella pneumoniae]|uniref:ead/Ea22-like family protein n=1 Tax=Klebsiella pneumoniae TaxID=573 RepID=UPI0024AF639F|nr:ead/Ea22-like family protein [Klebsiella pneumoniae]MDI7002665.1 ead/Ea22-like family protein [Klebsiella pneumoniae]HBY8501661.1 ead/Ea22-like family protein [Klebsiella pneumoniae]HBY8819625.1 ead/Ea22-like family protein [Klebsiella pneumoniae]HBY9886523.1 ead/Ea22-like family protein [Klebsiella pneumoniae]HBY9891844.1 ead/Ea22-like family protein [Klebsiella pneumoniae]